MLESAQKEVQDIRELALTPTPGNFQAINTRLESLTAFLDQIVQVQEPVLLRDPGLRDFVKRLPVEMAHIRNLMEAPARFYQELETIRTLHFGSYERTGVLRSLEPRPSARTLIHL
jgi:hypothetical protein